MPAYDKEEYIAVLATANSPFISLDWGTHSCSSCEPVLAPTVAYSTGRAPITRAKSFPSYLILALHATFLQKLLTLRT
jgi:hypothetical protein